MPAKPTRVRREIHILDTTSSKLVAGTIASEAQLAEQQTLTLYRAGSSPVRGTNTNRPVGKMAKATGT